MSPKISPDRRSIISYHQKRLSDKYSKYSFNSNNIQSRKSCQKKMINFSHGKENFGSPESYIIRKFPSPDKSYYKQKCFELLREKEGHWMKTSSSRSKTNRENHKKKSKVYDNKWTESSGHQDANSPSKLVMHQVQIDPNLQMDSDENIELIEDQQAHAPPPSHMKQGNKNKNKNNSNSPL